MNAARPRLSVVIPLYESERWIEETIKSVSANAAELLEIVVIDDGSTDRGPEIARRQEGPVRVISQQNMGLPGARNRGVREARGELIGFMDADDVWLATTPDARIAAIDAGAEAALGLAQPAAGEPLRPFGEPLRGTTFQGLIARREFMLANPLEESLVLGAEDLNWFFRMREARANIAMVEEVAFLYRQRPDSMAHDRETNRRLLAEQLRASLVRRGKAGGA